MTTLLLTLDYVILEDCLSLQAGNIPKSQSRKSPSLQRQVLGLTCDHKNLGGQLVIHSYKDGRS